MRKGNDMKYSIGIDIGGTKSAVLLGNAGGHPESGDHYHRQHLPEVQTPALALRGTGDEAGGSGSVGSGLRSGAGPAGRTYRRLCRAFPGGLQFWGERRIWKRRV